MSHQISRRDRSEQANATEPPAQRAAAPGKRTSTASLPRPHSAVQRKSATLAGAAPAASRTAPEPWIDVAMRPDLHAPPVQRSSAGHAHEHPAPAQGSGQPMPADVQARMEGTFGADFSAVRVHEGSHATSMGALAYTQGSDVHFAPGQYQPGSQQGQELLGHELAHVVQQSQGRVQATAQAKNVAINDDAALEREADEMGAKAARGDRAQSAPAHALASSSGPAQMKPASGVIQMKSDVPLMKQLNPLLGWAMGQIGEARGGYDPDFQSLFRRINTYDRSQDGRPGQHLIAINAMINDAQNWYAAHAATISDQDNLQFNQLLTVLLKERAVAQDQSDRLNKFTANADSPYEQMTEEGMLWSHPAYEHNTEALGKTGKEYFETLSGMNRQSMAEEVEGARLLTQDWFEDFVGRASAALSHAVVNHYTTTTRAQTMLGDQAMKSKVKLEKESATFKHNTSVYDDLGLGNSGFVFFFIESPNAPLRGTRFAEGDANAQPARISIPIQESGLLDNGWIMLSDFAQREYPDIMTNEAASAHTSWLPTRAEEQKKKERNAPFTEQVRHFNPGLGMLDENDIDAMMNTSDTDQRQAMSAVIPQARGDADSKQVYTGPEGKLQIPDRMFNNVLVGPDIIPGLATRAALEVARISHVNPGLGEGLKTLDGDALMLFMLKDLFRPQAMIPNSVAIGPEHVQT